VHSGTLDGTPGSGEVLGAGVAVSEALADGEALAVVLEDGLEVADSSEALLLALEQPPRSSASPAKPVIRVAGAFETVVLMDSP